MSEGRPTTFILLAATAAGLFGWWILQPPPGLATGFPQSPPEPEPAAYEAASQAVAAPHRVAGFDNPVRTAGPLWAQDDSPPTRAAVERQLTRLDRARDRLLAHRTELAADKGRETALIVLDAHLARLAQERAMLRRGEAADTPAASHSDR